MDRRGVPPIRPRPLLGPLLRSMFRRAGLGEPTMVGVQAYVEPDDPSGARMAAEIVRTLLPVIVREGIASADDVDIDTLEDRFSADQAARGAWMKPPTLVGAWARV